VIFNFTSNGMALFVLERETMFAFTNLSHHVGSCLPTSGTEVLVESDEYVDCRLVILDHVEQGRG